MTSLRITRGARCAALALVCLLAIGPSAQALNVTWNVSGNGDWDTSSTNWTGDASVFTNGDNATFNSSVTPGVVTLTANRAPGSTTVSHTSGTYTFTGGDITSGNLTKSGAGTLQLDNSYTTAGGVISLTLGTLRLGGSNRIADTANIGGGGTFDMNGFDETLRFASSGAVAITNMGNLTVNHPYLADRSGLGIMSGSGSLTFGAGHNVTILQQVHTYTGGTFINAGQLAFYSGANNLPVTGDVTIGAAGMLSLTWHNDNGNVRTIGGLFGTGSIQSSTNNAGSSTLRVGNDNGDSTWGGVYSGPGLLEKIGTGTLELTGANTYTGTTTVNGGTLLVNAATGANQGNYIVNNNGTLGGTGTINLTGLGNVTVNSGGTLAPGASAGTLTINGSLVVNSGAFLDFELGNTSDLVNVVGDLTLNGTLDITPLAGFGNGEYTLFTYGGSLLGSSATIVDPDNNFTLDFSQDGLVILQVEGLVPEPGTAALLGLGALALGWRVRRTKRVQK